MALFIDLLFTKAEEFVLRILILVSYCRNHNYSAGSTLRAFFTLL